MAMEMRGDQEHALDVLYRLAAEGRVDPDTLQMLKESVGGLIMTVTQLEINGKLPHSLEPILPQPPGLATERNIPSLDTPDTSPFTYLEGKVYEYLRSHSGSVCIRSEIKAAVWGDDPPSDTALQKIIERIRVKTEADAKSPHYLIAVRGQGYMFREPTQP